VRSGGLSSKISKPVLPQSKQLRICHLGEVFRLQGMLIITLERADHCPMSVPVTSSRWGGGNLKWVTHGDTSSGVDHTLG